MVLQALSNDFFGNIQCQFWFMGKRGKRQLITSYDYTKLCQLQLSVNKFPDAV